MQGEVVNRVLILLASFLLQNIMTFVGKINRKYGRRSIRLPDFDYSDSGAYFVTLIAHQRQHLFGNIVARVMNPNIIGEIISETWQEIPDHFHYVNCEIFVIMPNHLHGIIIVETVGATHASPLPCNHETSPSTVDMKTRVNGPKPGSLGAIIGSFKAAATRRIHQINEYQHLKIWQRNYYEHVIRDEDSLERISNYIECNALNWPDDEFYLFE